MMKVSEARRLCEEKRLCDARRLSEERRLCEGQAGETRNPELCWLLNWIDEPFIFPLDREILNRRRDRSILQNIDDFLDEQRGASSFDEQNIVNPSTDSREVTLNQGNLTFNAYPCGKKTNKTYPRFLAICRGSEKLKKVFDVIVKQSREIARKYCEPKSREKTVILVTDKWDAAVFKKYETQLMNYAINNGIWYIFLLATDYGYTEIPFLPYRRENIWDWQRELVEEDITVMEMIELLHDDPITYDFYGGTWNRTMQVTYTFDIDMLIWRRDSLTEQAKEGVIDQRSLIRFLEEVSWAADADDGDKMSNSQALDCASYSLHLFGKNFHWTVPAGSEKAVKLQKSIDAFIKDCEKHEM